MRRLAPWPAAAGRGAFSVYVGAEPPFSSVIAELDPATHVFATRKEEVDARVSAFSRRRHDECESIPL